MAGLFITLEGPDGAGKTTQVKKLSAWLESQAIPHLVTREPGGTEISDEIRSILLNPIHAEMMSETEILLYAASRAQHVLEKIKPALEKGWVVLCDRFVDASIAYQGFGLEMPIQEIERINAFATGGLVPDRTYFIDLPPDVGRHRLKTRTENTGSKQAGNLDRIEQKQLSYHQRVRDGFCRIYNHNLDRMHRVDGTQSVEDVFQVIKDDFEKIINRTYS